MESIISQMKISDFQKLIKDIYFERDRKRGIDKTLIWFIEEVGELVRAIRKGSNEKVEEEIADCIAWIFSLANLLNINVEKSLIKKYPMKCIKCNSIPCRCDI